MLIREKKPFIRGSLMLISFFVMLCVIFMPLFPTEDGRHLTGLQYSDNVFNQLSKGSSYFIPQVKEQVKSVMGSQVTLNVKLKKEALAPVAESVLRTVGAEDVSIEGANVRFKADLGKILASVTEDSDALYHNNGDAVSAKYGQEKPLTVAQAWWHTLSPAMKELQKQRLLHEAEVVDQVLRRAVEPGSNFYGIMPIKVSEHILLLIGLLSFYLIYTLWYGFGIFEIFEGIGLAMSKSKTKKE